MKGLASDSAAEWRKFYMLPIAACLGYSTAGIHVYGIGVYIQPISAEFGWSRTLTVAGLTIALVVEAAVAVPVGMLVDRIGPRRLAIVGMLLTGGAFALLGTTTGEATSWYRLWALVGLCDALIQITVWTSAVATRFEASRGLAFGVTLSGASLGTAVFPYLGTILVAAVGWRRAFAAQAGLWILVAFPLVVLFFRGAKDSQRGTRARARAKGERPVLNGASLLRGLRSTIYVRLLMVSLLFTLTTLPLVVHFVPLLTSNGFNAKRAAGITAVLGICAFIGRFGSGILLDRFRPTLVGAGVFLLPAVGCSTLLATGYSTVSAIAAAVLIGLSAGAELDVVCYLTSRYFDRKSYGALLGGLLVAMTVGAAIGPLGAAWIFDTYRSYALLLWLTVTLTVTSSLVLTTLPRPEIDGSTREPSSSPAQ